jgi:hypothetical protein
MDESGQAEYNLALVRPHFVRSCVLVRENQFEAIEQAITALCESLPINPDTGKRCEFHAHCIFHGQKDWKPFVGNQSLRRKVFSDMTSIISKFNLAIAFAYVHKNQILTCYKKTYSPPVITLLMAIRIVENWMEKNAPDQRWVPCVGRSDYDAQLEEAFHENRRSFSPITSLRAVRAADFCGWVRPNTSKLFLASDLCAFAHGRKKQGKDEWGLNHALRPHVFNIWEFKPSRIYGL